MWFITVPLLPAVGVGEIAVISTGPSTHGDPSAYVPLVGVPVIVHVIEPCVIVSAEALDAQNRRIMSERIIALNMSELSLHCGAM